MRLPGYCCCAGLLWSLGCGDAGPAQEAAVQRRGAGPVVATVNGVAIGLNRVQELVRETGLAPAEALRRLEDAVLLEQHAERRGYGRGAVFALEKKRALVRALLAQTVERDVRPEALPLAQVRERYEQVRKSRPELSAEPSAEHEAAVREQLALEQRQAALEALLKGLRQAEGVQLDEAEVRKLLSDPAVWGGSS